jgi:hypothetical protein
VNIDAIHQGSNLWRTTPFCYQGKLLGNTLKWMTQSYELVMHDICSVLHTQIGCTEFKGHWDYVPFMEFDGGGDCVWTNIMSGKWVAKQAVCVPLPSLFLQAHLLCMWDEISQDPSMHGTMFVGIIAGSNKTITSIATGHQEFHPLYVGPGNVDNPT